MESIVNYLFKENVSKVSEPAEICFVLENEEHRVKLTDITPQTTLNEYIRENLNLKGTKAMCREGGCGSCVVVLQGKSPTSQNDVTIAVNSCMVSILSCHGWKIFTVEGIGNPLTDYHPVQKILAKFNGTQCGFCSPGMVMNMYALMASKNNNLTMEEIENSFGGNICRCTGYRPILSAFKSLASDMDPKLLGTCPDIEDLKYCKKNKNGICSKTSSGQCKNKETFYQIFENSKWMKVTTLNDLLDAIKNLDKDSTYMLVCGNTAQGVFKDYKQQKDLYVDISFVSELKSYEIQNDKLILGGNIALNDAMAIFNETAEKDPKFSYLKNLSTHIDLIANVPVRNIGSLGGNLMMRHDYNEFPSDVFLILETAGAILTVIDTSKKEEQYSPKDFIAIDMDRKVLKSITLPSYDDSYKFVSYKIMPRAQNAHAIVNAGFLFKLNNEIVESATIVYGNINSTFIHAIESENELKGKNLFSNTTIKSVCKTLDRELKPVDIPPEPSAEMRKQLAISLFYKTVLALAPDAKISDKNKSGGAKLIRPISTGVQDYETQQSLYPLTEAIPKLEALAQTSGQAQYIPDMPDLPDQLFAAFALAEVPAFTIIEKIDTKSAMASDDVVAVYTKDDIPGVNNSMDKDIFPEVDEILCSGVVKYYEQPVAVVVAKNEKAASAAAALIEIKYKTPTERPLLTIEDVLKAGRKDKLIEKGSHKATRKGDDVKKVVKGTFRIGGQYHMHMETHVTNVVPTEDGLDVYSATQWMDLTQRSISKMLNLPAHKINVTVRRCGGGFGAKISRGNLVACAASLAAWKLRKPIKMLMPFEHNMKNVGKRYPTTVEYEVGLNDKGVVQYVNSDFYSNLGFAANETNLNDAVETFMGNYINDIFNINGWVVHTDNPSNTWCRAPGSTEGLASVESIMEHCAYELNIDPIELRRANFKVDGKVKNYIDDLYEWADIVKRKQDIEQSNKENRWKKKGLAVVPMTYFFTLFGPFPAMVSIFAADGSVQISHGGVEIGQGINTKVAQVCAWKLGIPLEKVHVIPSYSYISANAMVTGGSITSEAVCYAVTVACDELIEKMKPFKDANASWEETVKKCYANQVDLQARAMYTAKSAGLKNYEIYGASAVEVILDVLTGQYMINRADVIIDTGRSMSPIVDIGQVEGAFIMGLGYYTMEKLVYDSNGKILTYNTWNYKVPNAKDIPIDFRVKFPKNADNPVGVLNSKATGEPSLCMTVAIPLAIRNAVASARADADPSKPRWYPFDGPSTVENTFLNCLHDYNQYIL